MFRPMRRIKQQIPEEECIRILKEEPRGVLSVLGDDGYPYGVPIDHYYDEKTGRIYFHCAKEGHKLDAIRRCDKVSLCVYNKGYQIPGEWPWHITSVIVFGRIREVTDPVILEEKLRALGKKYIPTQEELEYEIARAMSRAAVLEMTIEHMTGKAVKES